MHRRSLAARAGVQVVGVHAGQEVERAVDEQRGGGVVVKQVGRKQLNARRKPGEGRKGHLPLPRVEDHVRGAARLYWRIVSPRVEPIPPPIPAPKVARGI